MEYSVIQRHYQTGFNAGIESLYKNNLKETLPENIETEKLILFLLGVIEGIASIKYPDRRPTLTRKSLRQLWKRICTKRFKSEVHTKYFSSHQIIHCLKQNYVPQTVNEAIYLRKALDKRFLEKVSLCDLSKNLGINISFIVKHSRIQEFVETQAFHKNFKIA